MRNFHILGLVVIIITSLVGVEGARRLGRRCPRRQTTDGGNLGRGELGHGLGSLGDGVLGQLTREDEPDGGLDLPGGQRRLLVDALQLGGLGGDLLELVSDERVQDGHGLGGDSRVRVDLLEDLEDVELVRLDSLPLGLSSLLHVLLHGLRNCGGCLWICQI